MKTQYYVYAMTDMTNSVLHTGITNNLIRYLHEHNEGLMKIARPEHTLTRLIFYEVFPSIGEAIARERQIKAAGARRTNTKLWSIEISR